MAIVEQTSAGSPVAPGEHQGWIRSNWGLLLAVAILVAILLLPTPAELPVAAHRMLAILGFAVVIWMTEAIDYAVSAVVIAALMAFLLGFSPNPANPNALMGTGTALTLAFIATPYVRAGGLGTALVEAPRIACALAVLGVVVACMATVLVGTWAGIAIMPTPGFPWMWNSV